MQSEVLRWRVTSCSLRFANGRSESIGTHELFRDVESRIQRWEEEQSEFSLPEGKILSVRLSWEKTKIAAKQSQTSPIYFRWMQELKNSVYWKKDLFFFSFLSVAIFHFPFVCWAYTGPSSVFVPTDSRRELKTHRGVNEMNRLQTDRRSQLYTWYYGHLCRKVKRWFHLDFKCFFLMDQQMVPYKVGLLTDTHFKQKGMAREWVDWGF